MGVDDGCAELYAAAGHRALDRGRSSSDQRRGRDGASGARGLAMLVTDAAKLRWMGVDMRSRWRRRVAVVATYAAFLAVVWVQPWWAGKLFVALFVASLAQMMDREMKDSLSAVARRTFVGGVFLAYLWLLMKHFSTQSRAALDLWTFYWIVGWSALSYGKLVEGVWMRRSTKRWLEKPRRLVSLDDFALHFYGERFAELTEEQQVEVCRMERSGPLGTWVKRGEGRFPTVQDERLRHEDDSLRAQVQRMMARILMSSAAMWGLAGALTSRSVSVEVFATWAWTMAALSFTLRQAIVLWTEEDPRVTSAEAEMELVEREA